jgi:iron complex outermembrane receptor protein
MKNNYSLGLLFTAVSLSAQMKNAEADTIRTQTIEDINLHKTGNPNQARPLSTKSNLTVMEILSRLLLLLTKSLSSSRQNN